MKQNKKQLSLEQVEHIAQLARIRLTSAEKTKFSQELSAILDYVTQLNEVKTNDVQSISQITGLKNIVRQDKVQVKDSQQRQRILKLAPQIEADYFKVKSVF